MKLLSSDARNRTAEAISSVRPIRCIGVMAMNPVFHRADVRAELGFEKRCFDRAWAYHVGADALAS